MAHDYRLSGRILAPIRLSKGPGNVFIFNLLLFSGGRRAIDGISRYFSPLTAQRELLCQNGKKIPFI